MHLRLFDEILNVHIIDKQDVFQKYGDFIGAMLGFILGVLVGVFVEISLRCWESRKKKKAVLDELKINKGLLPQKIDHLTSIITNLRNSKVLPGDSVHLFTHFYNNFISDVGRYFDQKTLANLHIINGRMRAIDNFLDRFFSEFLNQRQSGLENIFSEYETLCLDMIENCKTTEHLIDRVLKGDPEEVLWPTPPIG